MPRRIPWRFVVLAIVFLAVVGWTLTPTDRRNRLLSADLYPPHPHPSSSPQIDEPTKQPPADTSRPSSRPNPQPEELSKDPNRTPLTFETDPDPAKSVHCPSSHHQDSSPAGAAAPPLVQWALMIDAGSTGSRIHVYKFNNCPRDGAAAAPAYEYEVFRMTQPGLSAFPGDPAGAARSLDVLLDAALATVPGEMHRCTPVAVKATAGLRMLGMEESAAILRFVKERLKERYPFQVVEKDGVVIMDGKDEGVFAWITANYLLGTLSPHEDSYAVLDLGGASTQIVFEPKFPNPDTHALAEGKHKYQLDFAGHTHILYQHSYLGYGLMRARERVHRLVHFLYSDDGPEIPNPCLAQGTKRDVSLAESKQTVTMVGADIGAFDACSRVVDLVLAKDALCPMKPCSFAGVYHPPLHDSFPDGKVLLLSYFYDRISPLFAGTSTLTVGALGALAGRVCLGRPAWDGGGGLDAAAAHSAGAGAPWTEADAQWAWGLRWGEEALEELSGRPEHCLDLTFMHSLLRGYGLGPGRQLRFEKKVEGTELGWCLGATIGMLQGVNLECVA